MADPIGGAATRRLHRATNTLAPPLLQFSSVQFVCEHDLNLKKPYRRTRCFHRSRLCSLRSRRTRHSQRCTCQASSGSRPANTAQTVTGSQQEQRHQHAELHTSAQVARSKKTSTLDFLAVGPNFTRPACCAAAAAIDRYLLPAVPDLSSKPVEAVTATNDR